jgi:hypothetical protein
MNIIAIDPGASGGIAYSICGTVRAIKMPATMTEIYDTLEAVVIDAGGADNVDAVIEAVGFMPGDGGKGTFTFGSHAGHLDMGLYALGIPVTKVSPATWQKPLALPVDPVKGLNGKQLAERKRVRKNLIKDKMQRAYPQVKVTLAVSDALGIYDWAVRNA